MFLSQKNNLLVAVLYAVILFVSPIYSTYVTAKEPDVKTLNMKKVNKISFVSKVDFLKTLRKTLKGTLVAEDVTKALKPFNAPETRKRKYKSVGKLVKSLPLSADTIVRSVTELNLISDPAAIENLQLNVAKSAIGLAGYETAFVKNKNLFISYMKKNKIQVRPLPPSLSSANYFFEKQKKIKATNSNFFYKNMVYLPCGPSQTASDITRVIKAINSY